ncbi:MAG: AzlC family ABC transporter permease [Bacteroidales bacterium]|nr:AzlC family ABC transporter permease [Bacteroidales bacterium]
MFNQQIANRLPHRFRRGTPLVQGMRDGLPIGIGYYAVAFSLGIIARNLGIPAWLGFASSLLTRASAGEYGAYSVIAIQATMVEVIGMAVVTNLRYLLMSTSLTQKVARRTPLWKRLLVGCCMTDEVFGISIAYPGQLPPSYPLGATIVAGLMWAAGTASGIVAGDILPEQVVSALSVALYGMFIAIIVPPSRQDRGIAVAVMASFALSGLCAILPIISTLSNGTRTILLTVIIAAAAAIIRPIQPQDIDNDNL